MSSTLPIPTNTYLMGREVLEPITIGMEDNMKILLARVHSLLCLDDRLKALYRGITSGYRPPKENARAGGSKKSCHLTCEAVDLADPGRQMAAILRERPDLLEKADLYMEHPDFTKGWVHLQTRPTKNRIFIP